jgi:putative transcriptional regulator
MKRNLFAELTEGFDALKAHREGKRTLRTYAVESKPAPTVTAKELVRVRAKLNLSRAARAGGSGSDHHFRKAKSENVV